LCEAEQAALGVTHAEVGAWLIRGWHLDDFLADAVAYHHEPVMQLPGSHPLVQIVHLANRLAQDQPGEELPNTFRLGEDELMEMRGKAAVEVLQVARALGIDIEPAADPEETAAPAGTVPFPEERRRNRPALAERAESAAGPETVRVERRSHRGGMPPLVSAPESLGMDREAAAKLVERVRNHADISSLRHCFSQVRDAAEAMSAVRECLQMLFGATQVQFYLLDGEAKALRNMGNGRDEPVRFSVPADATASVLIKSLKTHTLLPLFRADASSVVDKQVIQMLGDEAMLCVPLNTGERRIGVMAVGGGQPLVKRLLERRPLLLLFAREAAMALDIGAPVQRPAPEAEEHMLLARKVAHEVNSPLAIMKNYLSVLGTRLPPDNPAKQDLRIIDQEIDRVSSIIRRLVQTDEVEAEGMADANTTLTDLLKLVGPGLLKENGIEVRTRLSEMPAIRTDARKLRQVLLNLIRNAAEAMPHGGRLTVSTRDRVAVDDRSCIQISIEDTGPGIPPEVMDRLFKPVKTSKGEGHAGLGLSIVGSLVKELRGSVRCESGKQGTRFHILLPRETAGT
jgi:signal transduction histidine kinase